MKSELKYLIKFYVISALCMVLGAVHGTLQVMPPFRHWLHLIGTPNDYPGRYIDPLAHAHLCVIGGVFIFAMGAIYHLIIDIKGRDIFSRRMVEHSFWWTTLGMFATYSTFMFFGIVEGYLLLNDPGAIPAIHVAFGPAISLSGIALSIGFLVFFLNVAGSLRRA